MLQFDNCFIDNKNKYFLGLLAYFVEKHWFDSIEIYYLQPSHSHDMVDAECFHPMGIQSWYMYNFFTREEFWNHLYVTVFPASRDSQKNYLMWR